MRETLFRGKTEAGEWVYGYLFILGKGSKYEETYILGDVDHRKSIFDIWEYAERVLPETVGQWTGLVDCRGVKIFEGDIHGIPRWIVTYCADTNEGLGMNAGWYVQRDNFSSWAELENHEEHNIIGNIYDNPELLK